MKPFLFLIVLFTSRLVQTSPLYANITPPAGIEHNPMLVPLLPCPFAPPANGEGKLVAGVVTFFVGVSVIVGGSVVRYTSAKSNTIQTGKGLQAIGLGLMGIPLGLYTTSNGRIKNFRANRKPRGFKNRHHYY
jgi:hypothetical protein